MQNAETTMKAARMPARNTLALALAAALSLAPMAGTAATLTVTSNADPGTTTTCTLRQAIVTVNNGTAAGSNEGNCRANSVGSFGNDTITFDTGAFPTNGSGSITLSGSRLDITANDLSIDGSANGQVTIDANSASSVISDSAAAGSSLKLSHLTLSNGLGNSISCVTHAGGGAVCSPYADLTLTNSTLSGNSSDYGGGIYSVSGNITLTNSTCTGNQAIHNGGCIYSRSGDINLNGSDVSGNDSGKYGGGINAVNGSITANNITINSNKAYTGGGGIAAQNGTVAVTDSTIGQNKAAGGGAIFSKGSITLARDTLLGNTSSGNGAGIFSAGSVALISSTVSGNSATESGGGIYGYKADLALTNSTLSGNSAKSGGGILAHDGSVTLSNATISGNSASVLFGGIDFYAGTLLANNAIVSGNNAGDSRFGSVSGSHNLIGNVANLNLGSLADNGGPTQTMLPQVGSAAIDAGDDSSCTGTGQRSFARPQGAHCDIGAVEVEQLPLIVSVTAGGAVSASATPAAQSGGITHCTSAGGVNCHAYFLGDGSVSTATLTATFDAGHYFSGWSGACVAAGSSASATVSMNQGRQCTASFASVSLSASGNPAPSTWGQTIVLSASWSGAGTGDGDSITFSEGSTPLCTATLSGGSASCNAPALTAGSHTLTAHFAGDSLNGETSVDFAQQVNQATQTITNFAANPQPIRPTATAAASPFPPTAVAPATR